MPLIGAPDCRRALTLSQNVVAAAADEGQGERLLAAMVSNNELLNLALKCRQELLLQMLRKSTTTEHTRTRTVRGRADAQLCCRVRRLDPTWIATHNFKCDRICSSLYGMDADEEYIKVETDDQDAFGLMLIVQKSEHKLPDEHFDPISGVSF